VLYIPATIAKKISMNVGMQAALVILGVFFVIVGVLLLRHYFSPEARWERRRRRSNARVSSTARRPTVKFNVRIRKGRRK
jgi:hypothetical protein